MPFFFMPNVLDKFFSFFFSGKVTFEVIGEKLFFLLEFFGSSLN